MTHYTILRGWIAQWRNAVNPPLARLLLVVWAGLSLWVVGFYNHYTYDNEGWVGPVVNVGIITALTYLLAQRAMRSTVSTRCMARICAGILLTCTLIVVGLIVPPYLEYQINPHSSLFGSGSLADLPLRWDEPVQTLYRWATYVTVYWWRAAGEAFYRWVFDFCGWAYYYIVLAYALLAFVIQQQGRLLTAWERRVYGIMLSVGTLFFVAILVFLPFLSYWLYGPRF